MRESIQDIVTRLLRYQRSSQTHTAKFQKMKHNKDILPKLQYQLESILSSYGKFQPVVYDTQGILDDGSDLILRHREISNKEGEFEIISFQIKSYDDLCKKSYMQELKAQRDDTFRKVTGLSYYFILLCTDENVHKDKLRNIAAEFRSAQQTEIIEPTFVYTFLNHPVTRVDAIVKRTLEADDIVFKKALDTLDLPSPSARALAIFLAVHFVGTGNSSIGQESILSNYSLMAIYDDLRKRQAQELIQFDQEEEARRVTGTVENEADEDSLEEDEMDWDAEWYDEEPPPQIADYQTQIVQDLDLLEDDLVDLETASNDVIIKTDEIRPLVAVIVDAFVRYDYDEADILPYLFNLFGVLD